MSIKLSVYFADHFIDMYESCGDDKDLRLGFLRILSNADDLREWVFDELDCLNGVEIESDDFKRTVVASINFTELFEHVMGEIELPT